MESDQGHVDVVSASGVYGWVAAGVHPERLAQVTCTDDSGRTVTYAAIVSRPDVSGLLGQVGRHGFALPLTLFHGLGRRVTFTDENGTVLHDGDGVVLPAPTPRLDLSKNVLPIILHIPKTAGSSLRESVQENLSGATRIFVYPGDQYGISIQELNQLALAQRSCCALAMGHMPFGSGQFFGRSATYATFLRQPMRRFQSNLAHILAYGRLDADARETLFGEAERGAHVDFDNIMTRTIAGVDFSAVPPGEIGTKDVELAIHNIRASFFFVGLAERYDEHAAMLGEILFGRGLEAISRNLTPPNVYGEIRDLDWERIRSRNRFDQMLYDRVVEQGLAGRDLRDPGDAPAPAVLRRKPRRPPLIGPPPG